MIPWIRVGIDVVGTRLLNHGAMSTLSAISGAKYFVFEGTTPGQSLNTQSATELTGIHNMRLFSTFLNRQVIRGITPNKKSSNNLITPTPPQQNRLPTDPLDNCHNITHNFTTHNLASSDDDSGSMPLTLPQDKGNATHAHDDKISIKRAMKIDPSCFYSFPRAQRKRYL